jgi:hypothetical protein
MLGHNSPQPILVYHAFFLLHHFLLCTTRRQAVNGSCLVLTRDCALGQIIEALWDCELPFPRIRRLGFEQANHLSTFSFDRQEIPASGREELPLRHYYLRYYTLLIRTGGGSFNRTSSSDEGTTSL